VRREVFVDSGAWLAITDIRDKYHERAVEIHRRLLQERRPLVTTNLVIAEAYILIRRSGGYPPAMQFLRSLRESGRVQKVYSEPRLETQAEGTLQRYHDHDFSLADAVSFVVMKNLGVREAFGFDRHFLTMGFTLIP